MDEMKDARRRLEEILDREIGHYDPKYYTADDLYWQIVDPVAEENFAGFSQSDVRGWILEWMDRQRGEVTIPKSRIDGDCFVVATHLGTGFQDDLGLQDGDEVHIVHGLPVGRGDRNGGRRFWHAWVEVTRRVQVPTNAPPMFREVWGDEYTMITAVDRSQGQEVEMPQAAYYGMGHLNEGYVWRFTPDEALGQINERKHYGPWVDGWEGMEDV